MVNKGQNDPVTVMTAPAVAVSGTYYLNASLTIEVDGGDFVGCSFGPSTLQPTAEEVGAPPNEEFESMALAGPATLDAGQAPSIVCINANVGSDSQTGEGVITAVLVGSSKNGDGSSAVSARQSLNRLALGKH
jgi:hypothetical protein